MKGRALVNAPTWGALDGPVLSGDCIDVMAAIPDCSVDAVVCDPPYGLEFMGKDWDSFGRGGAESRAVAGMSAPGIGDRERGWPSYLGGLNPRCRNCGRSQRGGSPCRCDTPDFTNERLPRLTAFQAWCAAWATEALRVLKPGGHLLAFGGTRTYHRLASGVEDAGFEIRDSLLWLYGSGFPKSLDVSKAIDKAERGVPQGGADPTSPRHGQYRTQATEGKRGDSDTGRGYGAGPGQFMRKDDECTPTITASGRTTAPSTPTTRDPTAAAVDGPPASTPDATASLSPDAAQWQGWGTALKPAHEPIVVARKPLAGTVVENVLEHGSGALNIDACRIGSEGGRSVHAAGGETARGGDSANAYGDGLNGSAWAPLVPGLGRWPANVVLSEEAAAELDAQSGESSERPRILNRNGDRQMDGWGLGAESKGVVHGDSGGASRFFYCAKTSRAERNAGLEGFEERMPDNAVDRAGQREGREGASGRGSRSTPRANVHPTVKPINLMRWLVRLVTPPGGLVLDPFLGSGSTGCAAALEGFAFVGIEREPEYIEIAQARIAFWSQHEGREVEDVLGIAAASERQSKAAVEAGQTSLLEAA